MVELRIGTRETSGAAQPRDSSSLHEYFNAESMYHLPFLPSASQGSHGTLMLSSLTEISLTPPHPQPTFSSFGSSNQTFHPINPAASRVEGKATVCVCAELGVITVGVDSAQGLRSWF